MLRKDAETSVAIHEVLARRWSPRAFDAAKVVSASQLTSLMEAARWSPSCNGGEPWRYLVWDRHADRAAWQKAFDCLSAGNQAWVGNAALLVLACAGTTFADGKPNRYGQHDTGMASLSLMLQTVALGLAAHPMAGFDAEKARAAFGVPADFQPLTMIAVGHQAAPDILPEATKARELAPRKRRALAETFFAGSWGKPVAP